MKIDSKDFITYGMHNKNWMQPMSTVAQPTYKLNAKTPRRSTILRKQLFVFSATNSNRKAGQNNSN